MLRIAATIVLAGWCVNRARRLTAWLGATTYQHTTA